MLYRGNKQPFQSEFGYHCCSSKRLIRSETISKHKGPLSAHAIFDAIEIIDTAW